MSQNKLNNLVFLVSKPTFLSKKHDNRHFIGLSLSKNILFEWETSPTAETVIKK